MAGLENFIVAFLLYIIKLLLAISLSIFTIYWSLQIFNKSTKKIDELEEIKKGNTAVAVLLLAVVLSIGSIVQGGIENITLLVNPKLPIEQLVVASFIALIQLLVSLVVAIIAIKTALWVMGKISKGLDYEVQLKKGNVAIALLMGGILFTISFVIKAGAQVLLLL
ncbi:MAG: DUF350 domain-containing protein [Candidatus Anstonellaceae archaeon]